MDKIPWDGYHIKKGPSASMEWFVGFHLDYGHPQIEKTAVIAVLSRPKSLC